MSNHVASIITEMKSIVATTAATITVEDGSWSELPFVHDIAKNNKRSGRYAYGVRPLDASPAENALLRTVSLDHKFEVILSDSIVSRQSDEEVETSLGILYDCADEIFKELVNSKVNLPNLVLSVSEPSVLQPEVIEASKIVAIRLQLKVKYRSAL